jgi:DNA-binding response OmpR family regulator
MRVMLVEDHDDLREATLAVLQANGFTAVGLAAAEEVDDLLQYNRPALYVVDLNLPGEDGLSLARRIRAAQPGAGIVMTTARTHITDRVQGYESGADIYLPKPVDPAELVAALRSLGVRISSREAERQGVAVLDSNARTLTGPSGMVKLSESELRLLSALTTAKEHMLERWQVAVHLGSPEADISRDSLQNRISQLRKKMSVCLGAGEFIRSVRKEGYKLWVDLHVR